MGGGRESNDVVFHVTVRVPSPTAVHEKIALLPTGADVLVGGAVTIGVEAMGECKRQ